MKITFTDAPKKNFPQKTILKYCIKATCEIFKMKLIELSYIFVSDQALLEMNREYLNHDYFTDIITFDNSEKENEIEGDIFISKDRVEENGKTIGTGIEGEYIRVIGHGLLHLCGLKDKTKAESMEMRKRENEFIALYNSLKFNPGN
jgi:probable rRNA maturation factor